MAQRKSVTLIYKYHSNWIGGTYYIVNIVKNLLTLPDEFQPEIIICYEGPESSLESIKTIDYPYISYLKFNNSYNFIIRGVNLVTRKLFKKKWLKKRIPQKRVANLYPATTTWDLSNVDNLYIWIPDFQEKYLPHFFSDTQLKEREESHLKIMHSKLPIVFSSQTALDDYNKFYPKNENPKFILQFSTNIGDTYKSISIDALKEHFNIRQPYFIVSNQFWKHKNHMVVIEAAKLLKEAGYIFQVVFTGKEDDFRNPDYIVHIKDYVSKNNLDETIVSLGFIGRDEQLQLMNKSLSIIQPSLFEGWSTVVEDAKALSHNIIISDIPLHNEQIKDNCIFFNPYNAAELMKVMEKILQTPPDPVKIDYDRLISKFSYNFIQLLK